MSTAKTDSHKVVILNDLCWELAASEPLEAIRLGEESLKLSQEISYLNGAATANSNLGRAYKLSGEFEKALQHLKQALELEIQTDDLGGQAINHNELGNTYKYLAEYAKSLSHFQEASRLFEALGQERNQASVQLNSAYLHQYLGDFEKAIPLCKEVLDLRVRNQNLIGEARCCLCLGISYDGIEKLDSALFYYQRAHTIFKGQDNVAFLPPVLNNMGSVYSQLGEHNRAAWLITEAISILDSLGYNNDVAIGYSDLGDVLMNAGNYEDAIGAFEKSLKLAEETGSTLVKVNVLEQKSRAFLQMGNFELAYQTRLEYEALNDSLRSSEKEKELVKLQEEFEAEKREREIERLKIEQESTQAKANLSNLLLASLITLFVLLLVSVFLYLNHRKAKNQEKLAVLEQKALRSQMNPHFIFNSLNSIQRSYVEGNLDKANDHMADFAKLLRKILDNSGNSVIRLSEELEALQLYIDLEKLRAKETIEVSIYVDESVDQHNTVVPPLILQPFVENAIWHGILPSGKEGRIDVRISLDKIGLRCTITDNGIGIEESRKQRQSNHESKAMKITAERLGSKDAVNATQLAQGGTEVTIIIPKQL